ncbi:MAG: transposase [Burkholderiales bacterium RIFCSPHIGHO2_12_FULL_67_38]|jgi:transposase|nr:MAG: transposase [Burkholderiales bacterium RIFCSPLOWO2_02_FULL_67_64]OGB44614.1 MAG: transposase [Burkholderiales bacterium RIFCSPHIGHO2_12_FULL_67_38]OGB95762.1 MAG: transposase [Burkholderiales bacterium RIFCSPLOWO2_12_FULL_67_210]
MAASYLPYEPQQQRLLPDALQDWLPEGHLAYFISDSVDSLDLSAFHARYAKGGPRNQPFHPAMMVKVLIYGYATGTFSSRKLAAKLHEDVALRVLAAENYPAHRTFSDFRALHLQELAALFVQVVRLAHECGLVKLGTVAVDGTKLKANASRHKAMSYERMVKAEAELKAQIDGLLNRAKAADDLEKNEPDVDIPSEIKRRGDRLAAITAAKLRLEQRQKEADAARGRSQDDQRKPRDKDGRPKGGRYKRDFGVPKDSAQESFTDTDSRIMKRAGGGYDYSYNAHTAVDEAAQIVMAAELTNNAADSERLPVLLAAVKANLEQDAQQVLADAGFRSEAVFEQLKDSPSELIVALGREGKQAMSIESEQYPHTAAMDAKLRTRRGQAAYRKRKWIVEAPNGWIKSVLGFRPFSLRGLEKVQAEFKLVCLALNLRRMCSLRGT